MKNSLFAILISLSLFSCSSLKRYQVDNVKDKYGDIEHRTEKSYTINETKTSFVGNDILKVKDYYSSSITEPKVVSLNDFIISGRSVNGMGLSMEMQGLKGDVYEIVGQIQYNNESVYLVQISGTKGRNEKINTDNYCEFCPLINERGDFIDRVIASGYVQPGKLEIKPKGTKFKLVSSEKVDFASGYINQELIYSGKIKDEIKITYREYTKNDLAKPAFYQELTYDSTEPIIRFKNFKIEIFESSNQEIKFKILEDGME